MAHLVRREEEPRLRTLAPRRRSGCLRSSDLRQLRRRKPTKRPRLVSGYRVPSQGLRHLVLPSCLRSSFWPSLRGGRGSDRVGVPGARRRNPYDHKAVRVEIRGRLIGHLERQTAADFRARLQRENLPIQPYPCRAQSWAAGFEASTTKEATASDSRWRSTGKSVASCDNEPSEIPPHAPSPVLRPGSSTSRRLLASTLIKPRGVRSPAGPRPSSSSAASMETSTSR